VLSYAYKLQHLNRNPSLLINIRLAGPYRVALESCAMRQSQAEFQRMSLLAT
jgi:hypothetical protein